jgi:predicted permease
MYVLNTLVPLLALAALGAFLSRTKFAPPSFFRETNRLLYWVALPALLFADTAATTIEGDSALRVFLVLLAGTAICIGIAYLAAGLLHLPRSAVGAFVQGSYRGNLAYVGLPAVLLALTAPGTPPAPEIRALAVLALALLIPVINLVAVAVLLASRPVGTESGPRIRQMLKAMVTNPLVLSCAAGLCFVLFKWQLPPMLRQICTSLGAMSTPLALISIGAALTPKALRDDLLRAGAASLIKVAVAPLAGYLIARGIGLSPVELRVAMIYLACPTATASYVMAQQLGSDDKLAGNIIVVSTLLSIPALAVSLVVR